MSEEVQLKMELREWAKDTNNQFERLYSRINSLEDTSENAFWLGVWKLVASTVIMLLVVLTINSVAEKFAIQKMVERGENPVAARCAYGSVHDDAVCLTYINTVKK